MAKKTKSEKQTEHKASEPPITVEPDCTVELEFTDAVRKEPETIRRLAHRVVDMLADGGPDDDRLAEFVSDNLSNLVEGFVIDRVTDLLGEARAAGKEAPRG